MHTWLQDLRHGVRVLAKSPGFTALAICTLAVGISVNTALFGLIEAVLLRPIPGAANPDRLLALETMTANGESLPTSYKDFRDYRDRLKLLAGIAIAQPRPFRVGDEEGADRVWGELVSGNYFDVLGVRPLRGRTFSPQEAGDEEGGHPVAVLSETLWRSRFHSDESIIGSTVRVNRVELTVIGVIPGDFRGIVPGLTFSLWAPATMGTALNLMPEWMLRDRRTRSFMGVARLAPGVSPAQARSEMESVAAELAASHPDTNRGVHATVLPLAEGHFGAQRLLLEPLRILAAVGVVVLMLVCANIANLLLARGAARRKEFSLRVSLGAARSRILRQLLTENLLIAAAGAAASLPMALWLYRGMQWLVPPADFPVNLNQSVSSGVSVFAFVACVAVCLISGIAPALAAMRADVNEVLKESVRGSSSGGPAKRLRELLVVSEVALAFVALAGAGLFARSFEAARRIQTGFDSNHVLVSQLQLTGAGYKLPERIRFCRTLRQRLESQPGILAAAYADSVPLGFDAGSWEDLEIEGYVPAPAENLKIYRNVISPGYLALLHIPLLDGREFNEQDTRDRQRVMIVNETFARRFFGGANPVGRRVRGWGEWFTVVGLARDTKVHQPQEPATPYFYVPFEQVYREDLGVSLLVRTTEGDSQAIAVMRREVAALDPNVSLLNASPLDEFIAASLFGQKLAASLLASLGVVALLLAAVGLYSVVSYSVAQRTQELGIRMALGARPVDVLTLVLRQGMTLAGVGLVAGAGAALAVARLASGALVHVSPADPAVFAAAGAFLASIALLACSVPAFRATRFDPNATLHRQ